MIDIIIIGIVAVVVIVVFVFLRGADKFTDTVIDAAKHAKLEPKEKAYEKPKEKVEEKQKVDKRPSNALAKVEKPKAEKKPAPKKPKKKEKPKDVTEEFEDLKEMLLNDTSDAWQGHPCPVMGAIVDLGEPAIPLILDEIAKSKEKPDERWFEILKNITGTKKSDIHELLKQDLYEDVKEQTEIWLKRVLNDLDKPKKEKEK